MLANTLNTSSYTKTVSNYSDNQTSRQVITIETGAVNVTADQETLSVPSYPQGAVKTLSIGAPYTDYSKYTEIKTKAKSSNGHLVNFSSVLGLWGVNSPGGSKLAEGQIFSSAVIDVVPMANINPALHKQLLNYIKKYKIYSFSKNVQKETVNGRSELVYNVTINLYYLNNYLNEIAHAVGLTQYDNLGGGITKNTTKNVQFYIDTVSSQLSEIKFNGTNQTYVYSSYGATPQINIPTKYIPISNIEDKIQQLIDK
jgi:hypothetical protein